MNVRSSVEPVASPEPDSPELAAVAGVFGLLADPGRLRILLTLRAGEANVGQLAAASGLSESAASHALGLLRAQRAVQVRRAGRLAIYALADEHVRLLLDVALEHLRHEPAGEPA
ncbi:MAG TPA: metalloregulator ArsR/SmtB family transcription factor [Jatrophihabitans sp.]|nr:metalloregulator ArsR/SmtB family transcription factor [Jatrophihabitans sp.]